MCLFICLLVVVVVIPHEMVRGNSLLGSALGVLGLYNGMCWGGLSLGVYLTTAIVLWK